MFGGVFLLYGLLTSAGDVLMTMRNDQERYQLLGLTQDHTACDRCGRVDLKKTAMLQWLDADGNPDGPVEYYGTTCAETVLRAKGIDVSAKEVLERATAAQHARDRIKKDLNFRSSLAYGRASAIYYLRSWNGSRAFGGLKGHKCCLIYKSSPHPDYGVSIYQTAPSKVLDNQRPDDTPIVPEEKAIIDNNGDIRFLKDGEVVLLFTRSLRTPLAPFNESDMKNLSCSSDDE